MANIIISYVIALDMKTAATVIMNSLNNITSLNESNFDYNLVEALRNSPYPQLAGIYSILKTLGTTGAKQVWNAYKYEYGAG